MTQLEYKDFLLFGYDSGGPKYKKYPKLDDFYRKVSGKIYHAVPKQHENAFANGHIVLSSAKKIRDMEGGDTKEGIQPSGYVSVQNRTLTAYYEDDYYLFCMSMSKNIDTFRQKIDNCQNPRILYEMDICKFISVLKEKYTTPGFFRFGINVEPSKAYHISVYNAWAQYVSYSDTPANISPKEIIVGGLPVSVKRLMYKEEEELRLSFYMRKVADNDGSGIKSKTDISFNLHSDGHREIFKKII